MTTRSNSRYRATAWRRCSSKLTLFTMYADKPPEFLQGACEAARQRGLDAGKVFSDFHEQSKSIMEQLQKGKCRMTDYVVRIVLPDGVHDLMAQTRTMLVLMGQSGNIQVHRDDVDGMCFDLLPPAGATVAKQWADQTANDFESYHFNAVRGAGVPC